jgi:hypothetical protein
MLFTMESETILRQVYKTCIYSKYDYASSTNRMRQLISGITQNIPSSTYYYDPTGNLARDYGDTIAVEWNNAGKITTIYWENRKVSFTYSPTGQRQSKITGNYTDFYLHDATGNIMAIYRNTGDTLKLIEKPIYGSNRLGMVKQNITLLRGGTLFKKDTASVGLRNYELSDHLGNVTATFLDRKYFDRDANVFVPAVRISSDYYPFGYPMPDRNAHIEDYRFGFNGQESDNEVYGDKQSYTADFWQYDTRLGRRWNIDPVQHPSLSPYSTFAGNPILYSDFLGMDSIQRAKAIAIAKEYVDKNTNPSSDSYKMGAKGAPGTCVDCSGLVSNSVKAGGEPEPNRAIQNGQRTPSGTQSGVLNIEDNSTKVETEDLQPGNLITWRIQKGYPYHIGIVTNVSLDKEGNKVIEFVHSSGSKGPNKASFTIGDNSYYERQVHGYYKWDTKPDISIINNQDIQQQIRDMSPTNSSQQNDSKKHSELEYTGN